jgi:Uma2 family endonuclease
LADLAKVRGKAELIGGRIVPLMPASDRHADIAENVFVSLRAFARSSGRGKAHADGVGYAVRRLASGRESFSPDASYYTQPPPTEGFVDGPPTFAVEVRSPDDYGPAAEDAMAAKRADYFEAGTVAVWDVDPRDQTVTLHRRAGAGTGTGTGPLVFGRGQTAHAGPAVPGWSMPVDEVFA